MRTILTILTILLLAQPVCANNGFNPDGYSFFTDGKLDRFYFDDDGLFYQQLGTDWDALSAGELLQGKWDLNHKTQELCLDYTQPDYNKMCFDVVKNFEREGYSLFDKVGNIHFDWSMVKRGNWLLSVDGMNYLKQTLAYQSPTNNIDSDIEKYFSDKILIGVEGPLGRMKAYFKPLNEGFYIDVTGGSVEPMTWLVKDGYLQMRSKTSDSADQFIITKGQEFLEDRPPMAVYYGTDGVSAEGAGFALSPAGGHEKLDLFKQ